MLYGFTYITMNRYKYQYIAFYLYKQYGGYLQNSDKSIFQSFNIGSQLEGEMRSLESDKQVLADNAATLIRLRGFKNKTKFWDRLQKIKPGISLDTVSGVLKPSRSNPTFETLYYFSLALNVPVWVLCSPWPVLDFRNIKDIEDLVIMVEKYSRCPLGSRDYIKSVAVRDAVED